MHRRATLHTDPPTHDLGLTADLDTLFRQAASRRRSLRWLGAGLLPMLTLAGCGGGSGSESAASSSAGSDTTSGANGGASSGSTSSSGSASGTTASCSVINEETAGPYPGDGSNSSSSGVANALALSGIVRSDIRSSIAGASGVASGVPLTVKLVLMNTNASCATVSGLAIYLWHCDALGRYSMYSSGATGENYLRGVQASDSSGTASFQTIFPGCYSGRMPHIHFEVYRSLTTATSFSNKLKTSQLALPVATAQAVYANSSYTGSTANLAAISFATDNVFSDGVTLQLASVTGNNTDGYVATLQVGVSL